MALFQLIIFQFHMRSLNFIELRAFVNLNDSDEFNFS